jgi:hypothetical protein
MTTKIQPQSASTTTQAMPSAVPNLTDWHTWVSLLTSVAAVATVLLHRDLSSYVPLVSIGAATLTNVFLMITKHRYAAALATASAGVSQGVGVAPSSIAGEITKAAAVMTAVNAAATAAAPIVKAVEATPSSAQVQAPSA